MLLKIYNLLLKEYKAQNWWPVTSQNAQFEIIIGAILTQNTTWKNVEPTIKKLKDNNLLNKENILKVEEQKLANLIRSSGYFKQKARKLKEIAKFNKKASRENLLQVWGVGKETADSILLYAYNQPYFVVDAYTKRIFNRIGFKEKTYEQFQEMFHAKLPKYTGLYKEYHALIVRHAKETCKTKPLCNKCCLNKICNYGKLFINYL